MNREFIWVEKEVYNKLKNKKEDRENFNDIIKRLINKLPEEKGEIEKEALDGFGKYADKNLEKKIKDARSSFEFKRKIKN